MSKIQSTETEIFRRKSDIFLFHSCTIPYPLHPPISPYIPLYHIYQHLSTCSGDTHRRVRARTRKWFGTDLDVQYFQFFNTGHGNLTMGWPNRSVCRYPARHSRNVTTFSVSILNPFSVLASSHTLTISLKPAAKHSFKFSSSNYTVLVTAVSHAIRRCSRSSITSILCAPVPVGISIVARQPHCCAHYSTIYMRYTRAGWDFCARARLLVQNFEPGRAFVPIVKDGRRNSFSPLREFGKMRMTDS